MISDTEQKVIINTEEHQYLNLIRKIIEEGHKKPDRTGTGTIGFFAPQPLKFSLSSNQFPLLTTKRVFLKGVVEELLWFISGSTNAKLLSAQGVKIWDANGSRQFLDNKGFTSREEGDLGPVYGFQWRHFGSKYVDCHTDYKGQGVDQLNNVIETLKTNPYDRRIILSAWNPADLGQMVLPPCHMFCQFYVEPASTSESKPLLHCQLYQRSCDVGLGVPFNIASYALLTIMIAYLVDMEAGTFTHVLGDTHIYLNHVDPLKVQIEREPRSFPTLKIVLNEGEVINSIDDFRSRHFKIEGYEPYPKIDMQMSV